MRLLWIFGCSVLMSSPVTAGPDQEAIADECAANINAMVAKMKVGAGEGPYQPEWKSLKTHPEVPDWFRDGKIGIYFHWGVYAVPAHGNEWYMKWMHTRKGKRSYYEHHRKTWGEPDEFGYHDFVPMFKAEHFDAGEWADLFVQSGARWAGPVAEHHDGFSMWASEMTPWNAGEKGPGRDIVGELEKAIKARGLKFVTSFHHERNQSWVPRVEGWPTTSDDPVLQFLYMNMDVDLFNKMFQAKIGEVIDRYQPDMLWFDGQMPAIQEQRHLQFLAYYFNQAAKWDKEVMVTTKKLQFPQEVSVLDFEKGGAKAVTDYPWLNDDTISMGSWCYTEDLEVKTPDIVLHALIDAVSKNGHLLLNLSPKADGTIPQNQRDCLLAIGEWLKTNGEAIYATRPWLECGEGPSRNWRGGSHQKVQHYSAEDIRFTRSKDGGTLYMIALGWPDGGSLAPKSLQIDDASGGRVELLGRKEALKFSIAEKRISIDLPAKNPGQHAYAFKLTGFETSLTPHGKQLRKESLEAMKGGSIDPGKNLKGNTMFGRD